MAIVASAIFGQARWSERIADYVLATYGTALCSLPATPSATRVAVQFALPIVEGCRRNVSKAAYTVDCPRALAVSVWLTCRGDRASDPWS